MPVKSSLPLPPHLPQHHARPPSKTPPPSQRASPSAARTSAPASNARPQREVATRARKRVAEAYTFSPFEQDLSSDSEAIATRPNTLRPTPIHSDDTSDSDASVADSESDCPYAGNVVGKKRTRRVSRMINKGERMRSKALKLDMGGKERTKAATDVMMESRNAMKSILPRKARKAARETSTRLSEKTQASSRHLVMRRAGLSDMSPVISS